jgi:hypothetical protein
VTVIDLPVTRSYLRKAKIAFFVIAGIVTVSAATVLSHRLHPILGLLAGALVGVVCGGLVAVLVAAWPVLRVFWHWSIEIATGLAVVYGWTALMQTTDVPVSLLVVAAVAGVPAACAPVRHRLLAVVWCVIVRHRLRLCFATFMRTPGVYQQGSPPLILLARPTPAGERVWVWLRTGLALSDLEGRTDKLAVACWANEVRAVRASTRYAALIRVDITRRDPLTATVDSPLTALVPTSSPDNAPTSPGLPPVDLDLPDVPEPADDHADARRDRRPRTTAARNNTADASTGSRSARFCPSSTRCFWASTSSANRSMSRSSTATCSSAANPAPANPAWSTTSSRMPPYPSTAGCACSTANRSNSACGNTSPTYSSAPTCSTPSAPSNACNA